MSTEVQRYLPSGDTPELVLQSINDYCTAKGWLKDELVLSGTWSPKLFYKDLKEYPVATKRILASVMCEAMQKNMSYLEFFEKTREFKRPEHETQTKIWQIFNQGSIMLYFEELFLQLLQEPQMEGHTIILAYLEVLSKSPVVQWNAIVEGIGACCYQFFAKEAPLYAHLIKRTSADQPEDMTDQELLEVLNSNLSPTAYHNKISMHDSRSAMIRKYKALH